MKFNYNQILNLIFITISILFCSCKENQDNFDNLNLDDNKEILFQSGWGANYIYPVIINISSKISNEDLSLVDQINNAVNKWNNAIGKKIISIKNESNKYNEYIFSKLKNGIYFEKITFGQGGWIYNTGKSSNTIASTFYETIDKRSISRAVILLNGDSYIFGNASKSSQVNEENFVDMESIMLHELGHFLGLGHVNNEINSVMFPYYPKGNDKNSRVLSENDIKRIRSIYQYN